MRIPVGPPLWFSLPYVAVVVWLSLSVAALYGSWLTVAVFATLTLITLPLLAVMFLIAQQLCAAAVVLAVMPAILFARIVGPYPHLGIGQIEVVLFYLFKAVGYVVAVWASCMAIYLMRRLPQGWRTPLWGSAVTPQAARAEANPRPPHRFPPKRSGEPHPPARAVASSHARAFSFPG